MRVLLASHSALLLGGSERSLLEIATYLRAQPGVDVLVTVPEPGPLSEALAARGVRAEALGYDWAVASPGNATIQKSIRALPAVSACVRRFAPDVVLTNTTVIPWFAYVAATLGIAHAWFVREDVRADINIAYYPDTAEALRAVHRWSDVILANSEFIRERYRAAESQTPLEVIYPSFDPAILDVPLPVQEPTLPRKTWRVIVSGIIIPAKNQLEVLEAAVLLRRRRDDFRVTVMGGCGSRPYLDVLQAYVRDQQLDDLVDFLDHQPEPFPIVARHDIAVVPSRSEPFGRVTVEAMALKVAVVASDSGGNREVLGTSGRLGRLYPPGRPDLLADALAATMDDDVGTGAMVQRAHGDVVRRFFNDDSMQRLARVLAGVVYAPKALQEDWITDLVRAETWSSQGSEPGGRQLPDGNQSSIATERPGLEASRRGLVARLRAVLRRPRV